MKLRLFYKTQVEVAHMINQLIDVYLDNIIEEQYMIEN